MTNEPLTSHVGMSKLYFRLILSDFSLIWRDFALILVHSVRKSVMTLLLIDERGRGS